MYTFTAYLIAAAVAAVSVSAAQDHFAIGMASVPVPSGWHNVSVSPERTVWRSSDNTQQLTVSIMTFESEPSFEDFKIL